MIAANLGITYGWNRNPKTVDFPALNKKARHNDAGLPGER